MESQITRRSNNSTQIQGTDIIRTRRAPAQSRSYRMSGSSDEEMIEEEFDTRELSTEHSAVNYRVGMTVSLGLVALAGFFDLFELALSLVTGGAGGYVKDFASIFVFPFLFWAIGIPFWKGHKRIQKLLVMTISFVVSLIPYLSDIMPELLLSVVVTLLYTRMEDRIQHKLKFVKGLDSITRRRRG